LIPRKIVLIRIKHLKDKQMKMRLFAVLVVAAAAFQGCTYEEGPDFSLRSKVGRLEGRWNNTFLEGGAAPKAGDSVIYTFDKDNKGTAVTKTKLFTGSFNVATVDLEWTWGDTKEKISLKQTWSGVNLGTKVYRILRLTNKEMWLENPADVTKKIEFTKID
jgi:hypothetical protein